MRWWCQDQLLVIGKQGILISGGGSRNHEAWLPPMLHACVLVQPQIPHATLHASVHAALPSRFHALSPVPPYPWHAQHLPPGPPYLCMLCRAMLHMVTHECSSSCAPHRVLLIVCSSSCAAHRVQLIVCNSSCPWCKELIVSFLSLKGRDIYIRNFFNRWVPSLSSPVLFLV